MIRTLAALLAAVTVACRRRPCPGPGIPGLRQAAISWAAVRISGSAAQARFRGRPSALPAHYAPGTIFINTAERRLYLVLPNGQALRYGIGVGRDGFRWSGVHRISAKKEWPGWTPPSQMLARRPDLPRHMAGGIDNPLGARAMYLGSTLYRIHGSNEPETIGQAVSSGCFRMTNDDVNDLYNRVSVGTTVVVKN